MKDHVVQNYYDSNFFDNCNYSDMSNNSPREAYAVGANDVIERFLSVFEDRNICRETLNAVESWSDDFGYEELERVVLRDFSLKVVRWVLTSMLDGVGVDLDDIDSLLDEAVTADAS
jgi:hypothetical protein